MKRQVFLVIGTIITKRSSAAFVQTVFCRSCRMRSCHFIQFVCDVALRSRFHVYAAASVATRTAKKQ